jgi:hypothetical protein
MNSHSLILLFAGEPFERCGLYLYMDPESSNRDEVTNLTVDTDWAPKVVSLDGANSINGFFFACDQRLVFCFRPTASFLPKRYNDNKLSRIVKYRCALIATVLSS